MEPMDTWCVFFAAVVNFQFHPGVKQPLSLEDCARIADAMLCHALEREQKLYGRKEVS